MAARIMGVYTSREGIAVAVLAGGNVSKVLHSSWHPSFSQPDGTRLYPAEELHKLISSLSPDTTILFDEDFPVSPLPIDLPRLRPQQLYRALKIELDSRSVTDVMEPAVGFCPGQVVKKRGRGADLRGFGLVIEASDLQDIKQKHRSLGITPDLVTLPIFPLAYTFIREVSEDRALLYLINGSFVTMALIRNRVVKNLNVFYGDNESLSDRVARVLSDDPGTRVYGLEVGGANYQDTPSKINAENLFIPLDIGHDPRISIGQTQIISRKTVAMLLARIPSLIGSFEYGGIRTKGVSTDEIKTHFGLQYVFGLILFLLLGTGVAIGVMGRIDHQIYRNQRQAIQRIVKSALPNAPPVAATVLIKSKMREVEHLRSHLVPMLGPSTLALPAKLFPLLDKMEGIRILEVSSMPDILKVKIKSLRPIDIKGMKAALDKEVRGFIEFVPQQKKRNQEQKGEIYTLSIRRPDSKRGGSYAE